MQSSSYPNIIYLKNNNLAFLGSALAEREEISLLHPSNPLTERYASLIFKLFWEIKLTKNMLWIGRLPSTDVIRIYFSEPYQYPAGLCCKKPVLIEIDNDRLGEVVCSGCKKQLLRFVRAGKGSEEEMFRLTRKQMKTRKDGLRELLTSLKFRGKKLRNNFMDQSHKNLQDNQQDLIIEISQKEPVQLANRERKVGEAHLSPSLIELKEIISDIFR